MQDEAAGENVTGSELGGETGPAGPTTRPGRRPGRRRRRRGRRPPRRPTSRSSRNRPGPAGPRRLRCIESATGRTRPRSRPSDFTQPSRVGGAPPGGRDMANLNKVMLIGRLTRDPETRALPQRRHGGEVRLRRRPTARRTPDRASGRDEPMFIDCEVFNRGDERQPGGPDPRPLPQGRASSCIEGRLQLDQWDDKTGGEKRSKHKIVVDNIQFLDPRSRTGRGGGRAASRRRQDDDDGGAPPPAARPPPPRAAARRRRRAAAPSRRRLQRPPATDGGDGSPERRRASRFKSELEPTPASDRNSPADGAETRDQRPRRRRDKSKPRPRKDEKLPAEEGARAQPGQEGPARRHASSCWSRT